MSEIDDLFEKKINEFMKYQKYILEKTQKIIRECFTEDVLDALDKWTIQHGAFHTENLRIKDEKTPQYQSPTTNNVYAFIETKNYDRTDENYVHFFVPCVGGYDISNDVEEERIPKPKNIKELRYAVNDLEKYKQFYVILKTELPEAIELLRYWGKEYQSLALEYLNGLDFSIPEDDFEEEENEDMEM